MKTYLKTMTVWCLALAVPAQTALAQEPPPYQERAAQERPASDRPAFRQEQLDQMLAPIALHPDPLLSQILMAATYPLEVVQAARWVRANPGLKGEEAVRAVESKEWDPSVKSLVAFPEVLAMMDQHLEWTEHLGEAFLAQQAQVMDTVQGLRRRAEEAGNLEPNERRAVRRDDDHIIIEPPAPDVVYVPYYDPRVVYGPWWWSAYPPVYWGPPVGYYAGWGPGFWWGSGVYVSSGFFFGAFSWPHRHVRIVHFRHHRALFARRGIVVTARGPVAWRHDAFHRRGVPYRQAVLRQEFRQARRTRRVETRRESTAPATRTTPTEQRARDRRSEQRVDPAPRQPRQDAQRSTTGRTDAPATRPAETRRGADAPPRRQELERREGPRERGGRRDGATAPRFPENRERQSFARPRNDRPVAQAERRVTPDVAAERSRQTRQQQRTARMREQVAAERARQTRQQERAARVRENAAPERARHARQEQRAARIRENAARERAQHARQEQRSARMREEARAERAATRSRAAHEERRGGRDARAERDGRERGRS